MKYAYRHTDMQEWTPQYVSDLRTSFKESLSKTRRSEYVKVTSYCK
jgi:hypothetical protein